MKSLAALALDERGARPSNSAPDSVGCAQPASMDNHDSPSSAPAASPEIFVVPQNPEACLSALPEELVALIVASLDDGYLDKFSRTDKRNKRIADALLYATVPSHSKTKTKSVADNAELAKNTKLIHARFQRCQCFGHQEWDNQTDSLPVLTHAVNVQKLYIDDQSQNDHDDDDKCESLGAEHVWLEVMRRAVVATLEPATNSFAKLTDLELCVHNLAVSELEVVFCIPNLESLWLRYVHQTNPIPGWKIPEASSNIKSLSLQECYMDTEVIKQLFSLTKSLEIFRYSQVYPGSMRLLEIKEIPRFSWSVLGDALRAHKKTLQELLLVKDSDDLDEIKFPGHSGWANVGSLLEFHQLREVDVALHALTKLTYDNDVLASALPSSLRVFNTRLDVHKVSPEHCATAVESLKDILVCGSDRQLFWDMEKGSPYGQFRLSGASQTLTDAGIKVEIQHSSFGSNTEISIDELRKWETEGYEETSSSGSDISDLDDEDDFSDLEGDWDNYTEDMPPGDDYEDDY
jgi:hypothetical protein